MCGLVGIYSSNMLHKHKEALESLLYLDTWRGRDSTGVAALRTNADTAVLKSTVPGYEFLEGPKFREHLRLNDFCWIGHNRFGTVGNNIKTNAHPFTIDDDEGCCILVGAHNGTLKNKHVLVDHMQFGTDSEALFNNIAVEGVEKTIEKVEGAWALSWYDHMAEELRFLRNKERPLYYAFEEGKKTLIWASELWMIRIACSRHDIKLDGDKVFQFAEDTLYRLPVPLKLNQELTMERKGGLVGKEPVFFQGGQRGTWSEDGWTTPTTRDAQSQQSQQKTAPKKGSSPTTGGTNPGLNLALADPASAASTTQSGTTIDNNGEKLAFLNDSLSKSQSNDELAEAKKRLPKPTNVRDILSARKFKGYGGILLTKRELDDQLQNGCGFCEHEFIGPEDRYAWLAPNRPVCVKCLDGTHDVLGEEAKTKKKRVLN